MKYTCTWKSPQNVVYRPVSDCRLCFDGEEKRGREVVHVSDTRLPIIVVGTVAVAVGVGNTEPDDRERRPADDERGAEQSDVVPPAHVDESREDVDEVAATALGDV